VTDAELRELLPLAALDALDADEMRAFEEAIDSWPDVRAELDELRDVVAELAPTDVAPPASLKVSVLDQIAVTDQLPPAPEADSPQVAKVLPFRRRWWSAVAVAAASVAVLVGALVWLNVDSQPDEEARARDILELSDTTTLPLTGELTGVRIVYSPSVDDAALVADDLPDPGADRAYQLWYIRGTDNPVPANVFRPDDDGETLVLVEDFEPGAVMAITEEPEGGSEQPTSPPIAASS